MAPQATNPRLTETQARYLAEIRERPGRAYNGRARRPLTALRDAGLIRWEFTLDAHGLGDYTERFECWPVEAAR